MPELLFPREDSPELTYDDAFLLPYNTTERQVREVATTEEVDGLNRLADYIFLESEEGIPVASEVHARHRRHLLDLAEKYGIGESVSRDDADFCPQDGLGNTPIVIANMNTVVGPQMAETAARVGATAAIPQDREDDDLRRIAEYLRTRHPTYVTPATVTTGDTLGDFHRRLLRYDMNTAVVVDGDGVFLGVLHDADVKPGSREEQTIQRAGFRRSDVVTAWDGIIPLEAMDVLKKANAATLPVLRKDGTVAGVITRKSAALSLRYAPHVNDEAGGLAMLAAVGAFNRNPLDRVRLLIELKVRGIILDTAHFDQGIRGYRNLERARDLIEQADYKPALIAGNIVTREGVRDILAAGADIVKVGIGPGAMCTTRMETGVGRPQLSAVLDCAYEASIRGKHVWADGGIQHPRDLALALAAGASQGMIGTLFVPTWESPGTFQHDLEGRRYKAHAGMASRQAAMLRNGGNKTAERAAVEDILGPRSEGVADVRMYQHEERSSAADVIHWMMNGVTSSMSYVGARTLEEFSAFARIGMQTRAGFEEGKPRM